MSDVGDLVSTIGVYDKTVAENMIKQAMQEIILCSLDGSGFFDRASFHGGTALRIFHGVDRFSEDLDFTLLEPDPGFDMDPHLSALMEGLGSFGLPSDMRFRGWRRETSVLTATISTNLRNAMVLAGFDESVLRLIHRDAKVQVKIDVDTEPPGDSRSERLQRHSPLEYGATVDCLPCLYAGKLAAILCRRWGNRVKGRDYYDFEWYVSNGVPLDLKCLETRVRAKCITDADLDLETLKDELCRKIDSVDFESARSDIINFAYSEDGFGDWDAEHFKALARKIKVEGE